ncbi:MAG: DNA double-strand break repair nuclease NurA [Thermoproteota archaeon]
MSSENAWSKLPIDLQEQFYEKAEIEARKLIEVIGDFKSQIELARNKIIPYIHQLNFGAPKDVSIAAIDGSFSPKPAETIGARFSVYSAGFIMVRGRSIVEEGYLSGDIRRAQSYNREFFSSALHVNTSYLERKAALKALESNPDLLLLDGSFLSFAYSLFRIIRIGKSISIPKDIFNTATETLEMTEKLLDSGKCVGIVKRGRSRAIGGWLSVEDGKKNPLVNFLDKQILNNLMMPPSVLNYRVLLKEPGVQRAYSRVSELLSSRDMSPQEALSQAREWAIKSLTRSLGVSEEKAKTLESRINRIQVKVSDENPPFELEVPVEFEKEIMNILFSSEDNFNMATGLPLAIDLIDESVSLPVEFTKEFVNEVEARIVGSYDENLNEVREFFTGMNPQKEF